jgi:hypothetical protein
MRTFFRRILGLSALAALGFAVWRAYDRRRVDTGVTWDPQPFPYPPQPHTRAPPHAPAQPQAPTPAATAPTRAAAIEPWVDADGGVCPATHPVKAKLASGIFHVPGGSNYDRTHADRCYVNAEAATRDGLRASKR